MPGGRKRSPGDRQYSGGTCAGRCRIAGFFLERKSFAARLHGHVNVAPILTSRVDFRANRRDLVWY